MDFGKFSEIDLDMNNWSPEHIKLSQSSLEHKLQVCKKKKHRNSIFAKFFSLVKIGDENHEKMHIQNLKFYLKNGKNSSLPNMVRNA